MNATKRRTAPKTNDPGFKGCPNCSEIKTLSEYYKNTGWCKHCCITKKKSVTREKHREHVTKSRLKKKNHNLSCAHCKIDFLGNETQKFCSQRCNCLSRNIKRMNN